MSAIFCSIGTLIRVGPLGLRGGRHAGRHAQKNVAVSLLCEQQASATMRIAVRCPMVLTKGKGKGKGQTGKRRSAPMTTAQSGWRSFEESARGITLAVFVSLTWSQA